jgi:hypothetical protein
MFGASLDVGAWFLELLWTLLLGAYWPSAKNRARDCSLAQLKIDSR